MGVRSCEEDVEGGVYLAICMCVGWGVGCVGVRGWRGVWVGPGVQILGLRDTHSHSGYLGKSGHLDSSSHKRQ